MATAKARARRVIPVASAQALRASPRVRLARQAQYAVMFGTGAPIGELLAVRWKHRCLDTAIPNLVVGNRVCERRIPIATFVAAALDVLHEDGRRELGREPLPEDPIFAESRRSIDATRLRTDLRVAGGLPDDLENHPFTLFDIRRSFCLWLREAGVDRSTCMVLLGHRITDSGIKGPMPLERVADAVARLPLRFSKDGA